MFTGETSYRSSSMYTSWFLRTCFLKICMAIAVLSGAIPAQADLFLDLTSVTPGGPGAGAFSGTLGGVTVTGTISSSGTPAFFFNAVGSGLGDSTIDGSSSQFSYSSIFSPTIPATDRVGFTYTATAGNLVTLTFSSPIADPVVHVANMDWCAFSFAATLGFSSLTLLDGNDGLDVDGVDPAFGGPPYSSALVWDHNPSTSDITPPTSAPPSSGARSAYASVQIDGTFSTLSFVTDAMGPFSDSGNFTISAATVPEPSSALLVGVCGAIGVSSCLRCRKR